MTDRLLSIGECMVEFAPQGDNGTYRMNFAGDTFNAAWYARRILPPDWTVAYGTCVGNDAVSRDMLAFMERAGIDTGDVRRLGDRTVGLYVIELQDGERSFTYWRGQSAARRLADDEDWLDRALGAASAAIFSGITLAILPPEGRERLCAALGRARAAGTLVAFDTNLRPTLWEGREAMHAGMERGASVADVLLPSFDDEASLHGDTSPEEAIARYGAAGARIVAVKNGAGPVHVWSADTGDAVVPPVAVDHVVDTTAAGDSFDAGFLGALLQGAPPAEAAARGAALSARVIQARGALVDV